MILVKNNSRPPKKQMVVGGMLGAAATTGLGAFAKAAGAGLGEAAVNRLLFGKGANQRLFEEQFEEDVPSGALDSGEEDVVIRITKGGEIIQEAKRGAKVKRKKKKGKGKGYASLSPAQKQVYKRGLAAYMSSGNRPKVSQHAWAMARVRSAFGRREAAKIRAGKAKKKKK
jgi:hypothetical protein